MNLSSNDIQKEEHSYIARIGLEGALLIYVVILFLYKAGIAVNSPYIAKDEQVAIPSSIIEFPKENRYIDGALFSILCAEHLIIDKEGYTSEIQKEGQSDLLADEATKFQTCVKSNSQNQVFSFMRLLLICFVLSGYLRTFLGLHFIDKDHSFNRAAQSEDWHRYLFQVEVIIRPLLYGSVLYVSFYIFSGEISIINSALFYQIIFLVTYMIVLAPILFKDSNRHSSWIITINDSIFILISLTILYLMGSFKSILNYQLIFEYSTWFIGFFIVAIIVHLIVFLYEFFRFYFKIILHEVGVYNWYFISGKRPHRKIVEWYIVKASFNETSLKHQLRAEIVLSQTINNKNDIPK